MVVVSQQPFNAFLSGFSATVGQFVLTASLRIQTTEANKSDFPSVSPERYVKCGFLAGGMSGLCSVGEIAVLTLTYLVSVIEPLPITWSVV